jgi:hypothetical protein
VRPQSKEKHQRLFSAAELRCMNPGEAASSEGSPARSLSRLKLARCPHSLAPTLVTLPSMSLIPSAPLQAGHTANIFQK